MSLTFLDHLADTPSDTFLDNPAAPAKPRLWMPQQAQFTPAASGAVLGSADFEPCRGARHSRPSPEAEPAFRPARGGRARDLQPGQADVGRSSRPRRARSSFSPSRPPPTGSSIWPRAAPPIVSIATSPAVSPARRSSARSPICRTSWTTCPATRRRARAATRTRGQRLRRRATPTRSRLEHLTGSLAETIRWFGTREHAYLRYTTKFDAVEPLLDLPHNGHTRPARLRQRRARRPSLGGRRCARLGPLGRPAPPGAAPERGRGWLSNRSGHRADHPRRRLGAALRAACWTRRRRRSASRTT